MEQIQELISTCREMAQKGYAPASGGNASLRTGKGIFITRGGCLLKDLKEEDFVLVGFNGKIISGSGQPSKELYLHLAVYENQPQAKVVLHLHPPHTIAATSLVGDHDNPIPAMVPTYIMRVRGVGLVPYFPPGDPELAKAVSGLVADYQVVLLRNHGVISSGETLLQASQAIEETEENARIFLLSGGKGRSIDEEGCSQLKKKYW